MDNTCIKDTGIIGNYLTDLLSAKGNYIGISQPDYERISQRYEGRTLLVMDAVNDIRELTDYIEDEVRRIRQNKTCSAILVIETNPVFLKMSDLSAIADAMEASGIGRFQNGITFNEKLMTQSANVKLFLFHE